MKDLAIRGADSGPATMSCEHVSLELRSKSLKLVKSSIVSSADLLERLHWLLPVELVKSRLNLLVLRNVQSSKYVLLCLMTLLW